MFFIFVVWFCWFYNKFFFFVLWVVVGVVGLVLVLVVFRFVVEIFEFLELSKVFLIYVCVFGFVSWELLVDVYGGKGISGVLGVLIGVIIVGLFLYIFEVI